MHFQEIKKKVGRGTQSRRFAKIIIKKKQYFGKKIYFVLRFLLRKKHRRPTKKCNNCRKLFGGGSKNLKIKLLWPNITCIASCPDCSV